MKISSDLFVSAIQDGDIYYFSSNKINTTVPHYFICIKRTPNDILIMSCCTSKFDTVKKYIESRGLPYSTLVRIKPTDGDDNPFSVETYVNCNSYTPFTTEEFKEKYESTSIEYSGKISEDCYIQILTGIHESTVMSNEIKEQIPKPEDI